MQVGKWSVKRLGPATFGGLVISGLAAVAALWLTTYIPSFTSVKDRHRPSDTWVVDFSGRPMESVRTDGENRSLDWVQWEDVSPAFRELLVRAEDKRFYSHFGIDGLALAKAAVGLLLGEKRRGASTLTMQLAAMLTDGRTVSRRDLLKKIRQMVSAIKLESSWTKDKILEAYVNRVSFRGELVGLRAASLGYFGKNPAGLIGEEAALLVALLRSPNAEAGAVAGRGCSLLGYKRDSRDCQVLIDRAKETFMRPYQLSRSRELMPVLSRNFVQGAVDASVIQTSLDYRIQDLAMRALREQLDGLKEQNVHDGAVLVLETESGRVVAYAANGGARYSSAGQIDGVQMRRQAGSTLKPFVYGTAFDMRILTPESLVDDSPADISISRGRVYHPRNYDLSFRGLVGAGEALGSSLNVPAVRVLELTGEQRVLDRIRAVGFSHVRDDDYYGPSLALGSIDVSLWELTHGYRGFASDKSPFSAETRAALFNILASPEYRRFTFGIDSLLTLPFPAAVKTGTSKDMRDNWCIGWTSRYTVGVWVGNFNGEPMWKVSGMTGAAPVWRSLMLALHPNPPSGLATHYRPPAEPLERHSLSRIRYPAAGMLVGFDPDIPAAQQRLPIEVENPQPGDELFLNNHRLSRARDTTLLPVTRGRHRIQLRAQSGHVVDAVEFEVR